MDHLLCDESWLSDPLTPESLPIFRRITHEDNVEATTLGMNAATVDEAISIDLEKELRFSNHGHKFIEFLVSTKLTDYRFQAIQWLIQTRNRLNLSFETLFSAANCFDRFVYLSSCNEWSKWMVELVILTSLSIASKFNEVASPSFEEFQMEGLSHMFHQKTILAMELIVLRALEWRVNSVTTYSFSQILGSKIGLVGESLIMTRITDHLLHDLCDLTMLQYPPSVVAVAAMWNVLEEKRLGDGNIETIMNLFGKEHKENIVKCVDVMKSRNVDFWSSQRREECNVKSLLSVLQRGEIMNVNDDYHVGNLSTIFQILRSEGSDKKKRDRDNNLQNIIRPVKRRIVNYI